MPSRSHTPSRQAITASQEAPPESDSEQSVHRKAGAADARSCRPEDGTSDIAVAGGRDRNSDTWPRVTPNFLALWNLGLDQPEHDIAKEDGDTQEQQWGQHEADEELEVSHRCSSVKEFRVYRPRLSPRVHPRRPPTAHARAPKLAHGHAAGRAIVRMRGRWSERADIRRAERVPEHVFARLLAVRSPRAGSHRHTFRP